MPEHNTLINAKRQGSKGYIVAGWKLDRSPTKCCNHYYNTQLKAYSEGQEVWIEQEGLIYHLTNNVVRPPPGTMRRASVEDIAEALFANPLQLMHA